MEINFGYGQNKQIFLTTERIHILKKINPKTHFILLENSYWQCTLVFWVDAAV